MDFFYCLFDLLYSQICSNFPLCNFAEKNSESIEIGVSMGKFDDEK